MVDAWQYHPISFALPEAVGARVRARSASTPRVGQGRRLRVAVRRAADAGEGSTAMGVLFMRWSGDAGPVTIYHLGWNSAAGGTEDGIRRAAAQLARAAPVPGAP
jgi:hypothetical protein